ncbi:uncharacterized protein K452DRAFT_294972 [Aplosporella prunicola CBS 121167]|uniref:NAD(P)-binding protein n=1 Tax=Aplosporella prunicola CBS 121167 TaxID=1176127 RepID=A0A6A6BPE0_9PEZI|nr:uncharacterized protein K452DRAFT_294972 [Aplosporella prunicola CBS 121167]KAF2145313.1 hypothetical protein K452DRAFT_294972 [Aplosporella prunicola CBS 121167]
MDANAFTLPFQLTKAMHRDVYPATDPSSPSINTSGKIVIVTDASGGIGSNVGKAWSTAGAKAIILVGRDVAKIETMVKELKLENAVVYPCNMTVAEDVDSLFKSVQQKYGRLDAIVNAAGTMGDAKPIGEANIAAWWQDYEINVKTTFLTAHYYVKYFEGKGTIVSVVSLAAFLSNPNSSSYSPAKLAQIKISELIGLEYPELRVFSVHLGIVEAENSRGTVIDMFTPFAKDKALATGGISLFLSTPKADHLTGLFLSVNWDIEEVIKHQEEILAKGLLKPVALRARLGPNGHPWTT